MVGRVIDGPNYSISIPFEGWSKRRIWTRLYIRTILVHTRQCSSAATTATPTSHGPNSVIYSNCSFCCATCSCRCIPSASQHLLIIRILKETASVASPIPQAATPSITAQSPQTSESLKGKGDTVAKLMAAARPKVPTKANSLEAASSAPAVVSTPTSSALVDMKGGVKRARGHEVDGARPEV
jgi:hypothetical protein